MQPYADSLSDGDLSFLEKVCPGRVLTTPTQLLVYSSDASLIKGRPLAAVLPENTAEVQQLMRWADERRMPVYIRGRGTNVVGDCVPEPPGVVLSTARMDRILSISAGDFVTDVEPGVNTAFLQEECEKQGLYYPPDPASFKGTSIGGNVVTCAGGMRALKYGVTRDFVLGCEAVLPGGECCTFGRRTHKNVAGLDLARLLAGSEGTLAFITRLSMKLLPKPETSATVMAGFRDCEEALSAVGAVFAAGILPCALEFMGNAIVSLIGRTSQVPWPETVGSILIMRIDGSREALGADVARLMRVLDGISMWSRKGETSAEQDALWDFRRRINPTAFMLGPDKISDDVTVPRGSIVAAVRAFEEIGERHGAKVILYGHVGDGNIHVNIMHDAEDPQDRARAEACKDDINACVLSLGGTQTGEHGIGIVKNLSLQASEAEIRLMRGIKAVFDPNGIMNPGKGY